MRQAVTRAPDTSQSAFGVYVHWPFCDRICPYCDFNVYRNRNVDQARWRNALVRDLEHAASLTSGRRLTSLYFGGGTPSLMPAETTRAIIDAAAALWGFADDAEITLEANPTSTEADAFADFARAGVNRLSLGVQSLRDDALTFLGRDHSAGEARHALDIAAQTFPRFTFDLIYARPDQLLDAWAAELSEALALAGDHISLYQLTIEPGTAFESRRKRGALAPLPDEDGADQYELTQSLCSNAGFAAYEVSNHARPGAQSRHNLLYWRYQDYAGIGPGAHGRLTLDGAKHATLSHARPRDYLSAVERSGTGLRECGPLSQVDQARELLLMGLRLEEGVEIDRLNRLSENAIDETALDRLQADGFIEIKAGRLTAAPTGRPVLNTVIAQLLQ